MNAYAEIRGRLQALFADAVENRVHRRHAPQNAVLPYFVVQRISEVPEHTFDGPTDTRPARFQITSWARTAKESQDKADGAESALEDLGFLEGVTETDEPDAGGEGRTYGVILELEVWRTVEV